MTASLVSGPSNGTLNFNSDGSFVYTPNDGYTGADSFTYQASDGIDTSNTATVALTVHSRDHAPVANDVSYTVSHNTPLTISATSTTGLLANATDADNDPLTASLVSNPANGTATVNSDGSFTYTPNFDFIGTDTFTYATNDGVDSSNTATVRIAVTDNAPSAGDWSFTDEHGQSLTVSSTILSESTDVDGDPLTAQLVSGPGYGGLTLNADGALSPTFRIPVSRAPTGSPTSLATAWRVATTRWLTFLYWTGARSLCQCFTRRPLARPSLSVPHPAFCQMSKTSTATPLRPN